MAYLGVVHKLHQHFWGGEGVAKCWWLLIWGRGVFINCWCQQKIGKMFPFFFFFELLDVCMRSLVLNRGVSVPKGILCTFTFRYKPNFNKNLKTPLILHWNEVHERGCKRLKLLMWGRGVFMNCWWLLMWGKGEVKIWWKSAYVIYGRPLL